MIYHQELLMFPRKVEPNYDIIVGPYRRAKTDVNRLIGHKITTHMSMIPHLHPIFKRNSSLCLTWVSILVF